MVRKLTDPRPVCLLMRADMISALKALARKLSAENNVDTTFADLVRQAVAEKHNLPEK